MYYEDEARRFNLLSGLACGALVGIGIALLMGSRALPGRRRRTVARAWR